jgi:Fungal Zn(2)-Cys(6) binuclear cluster domain
VCSRAAAQNFAGSVLLSQKEKIRTSFVISDVYDEVSHTVMDQVSRLRATQSSRLSPTLWAPVSARNTFEHTLQAAAACSAAAMATPTVRRKTTQATAFQDQKPLQAYRRTCDFCNSKKLKCSGGVRCSKCLSNGLVCVYRYMLPSPQIMLRMGGAFVHAGTSINNNPYIF